MTIKTLISKYEEYLFETRRYLHQYPKLSGKEIDTSKFLKSEILKLDLPILEASKTGFIAVFDTGKTGKTLSLRPYINGLAVHEDEKNITQKRK